MKHRIAMQQLKAIVISAIMSVFISGIICVICFFNGRSVDNNMPQYLIRQMEQYIVYNNGDIEVSESGLERLRVHNLWMQIVDANGNVIVSYYTPEGIYQKYNIFEISEYIMNSEKTNGDTVFICPVKDDYGIIMGGSSNIVTKHTYVYSGSKTELIAKCIGVFAGVMIISVIVASYIFSTKISRPIIDVLENIENIQNGKRMNKKKSKKDNVLKEIEDSLIKLENALDQNKRFRAEWISNISHDIKTPLSTIKGYAEMLTLKEYEYTKDEIIVYAKQIINAEEKIKELVEELKISQTLAEGKYKLECEKIFVDNLMKQCIDEVSFYTKNTSIQCICDGDYMILADSKLLKRCLVNIISNAYVHNKIDVKVTIHVKKCDEKVIVSIKDNGKGMGERDIQHIFERYYRGTDSDNVKGTGLGLAIAKEAVIAHNGEIEVESQLQEGTEIVIKLPLA
ncbi:MAG: HAMP domain-containing sensor histidine kinase [Lachnospiraceae bacterium]|nr:HAMP domain-containing histidine kinase [Lachnospiraceae bacterium]MEE0959062.1 HAMP domain-containing sensor histidine kinase [Lachnospiraceae bacterium]